MKQFGLSPTPLDASSSTSAVSSSAPLGPCGLEAFCRPGDKMSLGLGEVVEEKLDAGKAVVTLTRKDRVRKEFDGE